MLFCRNTLPYSSEPFYVMCFSIWYALVHTGTKHMTSTHVHSLYKQNSLSSRLDFFFGGSCEDIVRLSMLTRKSSTVVYFTLADLLETTKVQEAKIRDCHRCTSMHFASVYSDEKWANILKLLVVFGWVKIRFRLHNSKLHRRTTVHNLTMIADTWRL